MFRSKSASESTTMVGVEPSSETTLYLGQAKLVERRPISPEEYGRLRRSFSGALARCVLFGVSLLVAYACAWIAYRRFDVSAEVVVISAALYSIVALGGFLLVGRDWLLTVSRARSIGRDSEILKFVSDKSDRPNIFWVAVPANLLFATHLGPTSILFPVEPTEVAPESSRTEAVLDWMEAEQVMSATRVLEPAERQEIQRMIARIRVRFEWWEPLLLLWSLGAIGSVLAGSSPTLAQTILRIFIFVSIWGAEVTRWSNFVRSRRILRVSQTVGLVRILRGPAGYSERLLPFLLPWSMNGQPSEWRRS